MVDYIGSFLLSSKGQHIYMHVEKEELRDLVSVECEDTVRSLGIYPSTYWVKSRSKARPRVYSIEILSSFVKSAELVSITVNTSLSCSAKLLVPFAPCCGGGRLCPLCLGDQLDSFVDGSNGVDGGGGGGGLQQDEGVGGVFLAERPGLALWGLEKAGCWGGLEAESNR